MSESDYPEELLFVNRDNINNNEKSGGFISNVKKIGGDVMESVSTNKSMLMYVVAVLVVLFVLYYLYTNYYKQQSDVKPLNVGGLNLPSPVLSQPKTTTV